MFDSSYEYAIDKETARLHSSYDSLDEELLLTSFRFVAKEIAAFWSSGIWPEALDQTTTIKEI